MSPLSFGRGIVAVDRTVLIQGAGIYSYAYDAVGNREAFTFTDGTVTDTSVYTYNAVNWLTEVDDTAYLYDANGSLLSDGVSSYAYDGANRLVGVTAGSNVHTYVYDGIGNRVAQSVNSQSTNYTLDVAGGLPEVILAGSVRYLQVGGQLLAQTNAGNWQYILPDHLGSVRQLTDGAGEVILAQDYDPFGNALEAYGAGASGFGYTGEQQDDSGLLFLRARYYDAGMGRFVSQDPFAGALELPYSQHPYQYGYSNPVRYTDPSGQCVPVLALVDGPIIPIGDVMAGLTCAGLIASWLSAQPAPHIPQPGIPSGESIFGGTTFGYEVGTGAATSFAPQVLPAPVARPVSSVVATPRILPMVVAPQPNQSPDEEPEPYRQPRIVPVPAPTAICTPEPERTLFHYTYVENIPAIIALGLRPSIRDPLDPRSDAQWGDGHYLTDATPNEASNLTRQQFSYALFRHPYKLGAPPAPLRTAGWIEIDVSDLPIVRTASLFGNRLSGRSIFLNPGTAPLPMVDRVKATGTVIFQPGPSGNR